MLNPRWSGWPTKKIVVSPGLRLPAAMHWEGHAKVLAQGNTLQWELKTALKTAWTAAVRHS
jgi:hypothetical protein